MKYTSIIGLVLLLALLLAACGQPLDGTPGTDPSDEASAEDRTRVLSDSVLELPASVRPYGAIVVPSVRSLATDAYGDAGTLYDLVPHYVEFAAEVRDFVVEIVDAVVDNIEWLETSGVSGVRQDLNDDTFSGYLFEKDQSAATGHDYRLTLYTVETPATEIPGIVVDFSVGDSGWARGTMRVDVAQGFEADIDGDGVSETVSHRGTAVESRLQAQVEFDATAPTKTLAIRYSKSLANLIAWAEDSATTDAEVSAADLGQPQQISLVLQLAGSRYTVSGYSFHPGIDVLDARGLEEFYSIFNGTGDGYTRHTFLSRAIVDAPNGVETGAKLAVAFPDDEQSSSTPRSGIDDVFVSDALGPLYSQYLVTEVNAMLDAATGASSTDLVEGVVYSMWLHNLLPPVDTSGLDETMYNELVAWIAAIKAGLDTAGSETAYRAALETAGATGPKADPADVRIEEIDFVEAAAASESTTLTAKVQELYDLVHDAGVAVPFETANAYYQDPTAVGADPSSVDAIQLILWLYVHLPGAFQGVLADTYLVSEAELRAFLSLNAEDVLLLDAEMETAFIELKATFDSIQYIINPAFYVPGTAGGTNFVGTYDEDPSVLQFYAYTPGVGLAASTDETPIAGLSGLDLNSVTVLVPLAEGAFFDTFESPATN